MTDLEEIYIQPVSERDQAPLESPHRMWKVPTKGQVHSLVGDTDMDGQEDKQEGRQRAVYVCWLLYALVLVLVTHSQMYKAHSKKL